MIDIDTTLQKLRIEELNQMQKDVMHAVLRTNRDVIVLAPTGSGKTLAYLLPLAAHLWNNDETQAVVIVPSRELAIQSNEVMRSMGTGFRSMALYGGRPTMDEHREMERLKPHVLFATPGRLNDHIDKQNFDVRTVRFLVIDEFDKCLRMGFRAEMQKAIDRLPNIEQRVLLSATDSEEMPAFVRMGRTEYVNYLDNDEQTPERIRLFTVQSLGKDKIDTVSLMLHDFDSEQSIVFLNYRDGVERVTKYLADEGFAVCAYHGGLDQRQREEAIYRFSNKSVNVLVATDLAARGLDIPDVDNIIHYNLPVGEEEYIHRTGRTGRWDAKGNSFIILGPEEHMPEYVKEHSEEYILEKSVWDVPRPRMATLYIGKGKKDKISKGDILGFLCKTCGLSGELIGRIDVYERFAYAAVDRWHANDVIKKAEKGAKIKGVRTVVQLAFEKIII